MFNIVKKYINGNFNYIEITPNVIVRNGLSTFDFREIEKKFTIVDCSQNYADEYSIRVIAESMISCSVSGLLLSPLPVINTKNIKYFPLCACFGVASWNKQISISEPRPYMYSCLNRNSHIHRIINWLTLRDVPNGLWSMYNLETTDVVSNINDLGDLNNQWQQEKKLLSSECINDLSCNHPAFTQSYINIVTETIMRGEVFIGEKTWKPIASGQFFLILGCAGTVSYLRNIGVDVFDDIIDHSYDLEPDWRKRIQLMQQSFQKLVSMNVADLWQQTQQRRAQNRTNFFNGHFINSYIKEINDSISKIRECC